jgi:ribosomal-protein-alanine N-acetyltransferase
MGLTVISLHYLRCLLGSSGKVGSTVQISTERLLLREFEATDGPALHAFESLPEVVRYQSFAPRSLTESHDYVVASIDAAREEPRRVYDLAVILKAEDRVIGRCGFAVGDPDDEQAVLWYTVHPEYWGHGYAPEAARALVSFGFREVGLHRIWADTDPENVASIRVLEKLGLRLEGHLRENARINDVWADSLIFAILEREWR